MSGPGLLTTQALELDSTAVMRSEATSTARVENDVHSSVSENVLDCNLVVCRSVLAGAHTLEL